MSKNEESIWTSADNLFRTFAQRHLLSLLDLDSVSVHDQMRAELTNISRALPFLSQEVNPSEPMVTI